MLKKNLVKLKQEPDDAMQKKEEQILQLMGETSSNIKKIRK